MHKCAAYETRTVTKDKIERTNEVTNKKLVQRVFCFLRYAIIFTSLK